MDSMWAPFLTWQFAVAATAVAALMGTLKSVAFDVRPAWFAKGCFKAVMSIANIALGLLAAAPAGFLQGDTFGQRALLGIVAGFVSQFVYHAFLKRIGGSDDQAPPAPAAAPDPSP
jgi:hypothetical protein